MSIDELIALVPPPEHPVEVGTLDDFRRVEEALGIRLPSDYRHFILRYGSGQFAAFYRIYNAFSQKRYIGLESAVQPVCDAERVIKKSFPDLIPYEIYPASPGLLPWGADENGNFYFWLTDGTPDEWPVVQDEVRGSGIAKFDCTMTQFLVKILRGEVEPLAGDYPLPEDFHFLPDSA